MTKRIVGIKLDAVTLGAGLLVLAFGHFLIAGILLIVSAFLYRYDKFGRLRFRRQAEWTDVDDGEVPREADILPRMQDDL